LQESPSKKRGRAPAEKSEKEGPSPAKRGRGRPKGSGKKSKAKAKVCIPLAAIFYPNKLCIYFIELCLKKSLTLKWKSKILKLTI